MIVSEMRCPASLIKDNPSTSGRHGPTYLSNASQSGKEAASVRSRHAGARHYSLSSKVCRGVLEDRTDRNSDHIITGESPLVRSRTDDLLRKASSRQRLCTAGCSTITKRLGVPQRRKSSFSMAAQIPNIQRKHAEMEVRCAGTAIGWPTEVSDISEGREGDGKPVGPYCIYVGPLELADKCRLEALYQQARDEYYSGTPLILDDMFDKIEFRLRRFGSLLVLKYPRCSLKRYSAYADAELDQSQLVALSGVWASLLFGGLLLATGPPLCMAQAACQHILFGMGETGGMGWFNGWQWGVRSLSSPGELNAFLMMGLSMLFGGTLASAAAKSLDGLSAGNLVALKGCCPACGEEVYAFVKANESHRPRHKCECHVCSHPLVFHANLEIDTRKVVCATSRVGCPRRKRVGILHGHYPSKTHRGRMWAYGRIYLVVRSTDLAPQQLSSRNGSRQ